MKRLRFVAVIFCIAVVALVISHSSKAQGRVSKPANVKEIPSTAEKEKPAGAAVDTSVHPVTQAFIKQGGSVCASRVNQISNFLTANTQTGAYLHFAPDQQDQHIFSESLEVIAGSNPSAFVSSSFAPTPNGGCEAVYDTVQFTQEACADVATKRFNFKGALAVLKKDIIMLNVGTVRFFLIPAGSNGCVVIKKEVIQ